MSAIWIPGGGEEGDAQEEASRADRGRDQEKRPSCHNPGHAACEADEACPCEEFAQTIRHRAHERALLQREDPAGAELDHAAERHGQPVEDERAQNDVWQQVSIDPCTAAYERQRFRWRGSDPWRGRSRDLLGDCQ